ncbi:MAG: hypothetical protein ACTSVI_09600 [Promethearchaeota archaeon]
MLLFLFFLFLFFSFSLIMPILVKYNQEHNQTSCDNGGGYY